MATELDQLWELYFPGASRPDSYSGDALENEFRPLAKPEDFYKDTAALSTDQLHCLAANNQGVLQDLQHEFAQLESTINNLKHKDPSNQPLVKNPQLLPAPIDYEERKESVLYGYKYDPKRPMAPNFLGQFPIQLKDLSEAEKYDLRMEQDPWTQGGFVPGKRQYETMRSKAKDPQNPDGWGPVLRRSRRMIVKPYIETIDDKMEKFGARYAAIQAGHQPGQSNSTSLDDLGPRTRRGTPNIINKPLRNTRFNGAKIPVTRDPSEVPSLAASRASTPKRKRDDTPALADHSGQPAKKLKIMQTPPVKRKGQNQYTKAKRLLEEGRQAALLAGLGEIAVPSTQTSVSTTMTNTPPPKKRHNQYTKAKERAEKERASASIEPSPPSDRLASTPSIPDPAQTEEQQAMTPPPPITKLVLTALPVSKTPKAAHTDNPFWKSLTADEKFAYKGWVLEDLIACIKDDHSWVAGPFRDDQAMNDSIKDLVLNAAHPTRTYAAKRNWLEMKFENRHLRGPRKKIKASDITSQPASGPASLVEDMSASPQASPALSNDMVGPKASQTTEAREPSIDSAKEQNLTQVNGSQEKVNGKPEPITRPRRSGRK